ncbi:MAG: hypothetical protein K0U64_06385 [Actinomycetia bacterium]|nr:hypothetical protein [Actinomycetes bacterium]
MGSEGVIPVGWPADLPPAFAEEFAHRVVGWLLDRGPAGLRGRRVWRQEPAALALVTKTHCEQELAGLRTSYASARRELDDQLSPEAVDLVLVALEAAGAEAAETLRQVSLVAEALAGKRWRARL